MITITIMIRRKKADDMGDYLTMLPLVDLSGYAGTRINGGRTFLSAILKKAV